VKKLASLAILCFSTALLQPINIGFSQEPNGQTTDEIINEPVYREIVYGEVNAPVTIIEYASLTCSHCATFHNVVFPEIKKNYVDTGKVRFIFRDFPLDGLAMAGAILARCAPNGRNKALLSIMFKICKTCRDELRKS
jgi:protein-disulfide isomerase